MFLLLSDDLLFTSRIVGTARAEGLSVRVARSAEALAALAKDGEVKSVLIDLANPGLEITECLSWIRSCRPDARVVAYGAHVDTKSLKDARAAGCDLVLTRGQFVEMLEKGEIHAFL